MVTMHNGFSARTTIIRSKTVAVWNIRTLMSSVESPNKRTKFMETREVIESPLAPKAIGPYSQAIKANGIFMFMVLDIDNDEGYLYLLPVPAYRSTGTTYLLYRYRLTGPV